MKTEKDFNFSQCLVTRRDQPDRQPMLGRRYPDYKTAGELGGWEDRMSHLARVDS